MALNKSDLHCSCFVGSMRNNTCTAEELTCEPDRTCLDPDVICDFSSDCPNEIDEGSICGESS